MLSKTLEGIRVSIARDYGSARKLGEAADVSPNVLSRWLSGSRIPDFGKLSRVLEVIGADVLFPWDPRLSETSPREHIPSPLEAEVLEQLKGFAHVTRETPDSIAKKAFPDAPGYALKIRNYFEGKAPIPLGDFHAIATALGQSPGDILCRAAEWVEAKKAESNKERLTG